MRQIIVSCVDNLKQPHTPHLGLKWKYIPISVFKETKIDAMLILYSCTFSLLEKCFWDKLCCHVHSSLMLPRAMTLLSFLLDFLSLNVKCMYKSVFKITHLSPVINCTLQWKEKCFHVEHVFCLQTRTGGIVYCVHSRVKQCRPELPHRLKFKGVICRGHHSEAKWVF